MQLDKWHVMEQTLTMLNTDNDNKRKRYTLGYPPSVLR
jgi:hypothetical protein